MPIDMLVASKKGGGGEGASPFTMQLGHARMAFYDEGPQGTVMNMSAAKRITGSGMLPARGLYEKAPNGGVKTRT
jgi:phage/plasmid-associated DNA primase